MLDPRVYRMGLVACVLAVLLFAFSLSDQPGALSTTLAPDAFNGQNVSTEMSADAAGYPVRRPGSAGDDALAGHVAQQFSRYKFSVSTTYSTAHTVDGTRTLETVIGTRVGLTQGSIVVVAHRDALSSPATADLAGTATLLELARALGGQTQHRTIVLASISGSIGSAGTTALARALPRPVDAVIVLGDLSGGRVRQPIVVPWSDGQVVAPPALRNTLAASLGSQAGLKAGGASFFSHFARLAFPYTVTEQGPFGAHGQPAALVSLSGESVASSSAAVNVDTLTHMGRTVLQTVSSLDTGPSVAAPSAYVLFDAKVVPSWAVRLLVLAFVIPVLGATIDGVARARRRGFGITRWVVWVFTGSLPFILASLVVLGGKLVGLVGTAPPGPVPDSLVPIHGAGVVVMVGAALALIAGFALIRPFVARIAGVARPRREAPNDGAGAALLLVMCCLTVTIWVSNPFAAALLVPALHLWMWVVAPEVRLHPSVALAFLCVGIAPVVLVAASYAATLSLGPITLAWNWIMLLVGGHLSWSVTIEWCVALGCAASVVAIVARRLIARGEEPEPVTIRGPVTYAGPGSLGGTESALRR